MKKFFFCGVMTLTRAFLLAVITFAVGYIFAWVVTAAFAPELLSDPRLALVPVKAAGTVFIGMLLLDIHSLWKNGRLLKIWEE